MTLAILTDAFSAIAGIGAGIIIFLLLIMVLMIVSMWVMFQKANRPGWAAIVPIYNQIVFLQTAGLSGWWVLFYLVAMIPVVGAIAVFVFNIIVFNKISQAFGHGVGFTIGLIFLPIIFFPIIAFGDSKYQLGEAKAQ